MAVSESIKKIKNNNFFITVGSNEFLRDQIKNKIVSENKELEFVSLDASAESENEIFFKLKYKDLFRSKKIFYIKNFIKIKKLDLLLDNSITHLVILDSKEKSKSKIFKNLEKKYLLIECDLPKKWEEEDDATKKIISFFKKNNYEIDYNTACHMYHNTGYDLYKIFRECQKILIYKENKDDKKINENDINKICNFEIKYDIFNIIYDVVEGRKKEAVNNLYKIYKYESNPSILLITTMYTYFENLLYMRGCPDLRNSHIKIPPIIIEKNYKPFLSVISEKKVIDSLIYFSNLDFNLRKGIFDVKLHIENFILNF